MEISTPCRIATVQNLILKFGTRDYVRDVTSQANFRVDWFCGSFSPNTWNITCLWLFLYCPYLFLSPLHRSNRGTGVWLKRRVSAHGGALLELERTWVTPFGGNMLQNPIQNGRELASLCQISEIVKSRNIWVALKPIKTPFRARIDGWGH